MPYTMAMQSRINSDVQKLIIVAADPSADWLSLHAQHPAL